MKRHFPQWTITKSLEQTIAELKDGYFTAGKLIIRSMTAAERNDPSLINGSRRKRIALGSGSTIQDVNRLVKQFDQVRKMMKQMSSGKGRNPLGAFKLPPGMGP